MQGCRKSWEDKLWWDGRTEWRNDRMTEWRKDGRTDKANTKCPLAILWRGHKNIDVCETLMPPFPNMTFDLDLWPTDLKINRDHLLIKDYLPTKFEASGAKPSWVISCKKVKTDRHTDRPTDGPTCATQYAPPFSKGGINMSVSSNRTDPNFWLRPISFYCLG